MRHARTFIHIIKSNPDLQANPKGRAETLPAPHAEYMSCRRTATRHGELPRVPRCRDEVPHHLVAIANQSATQILKYLIEEVSQCTALQCAPHTMGCQHLCCRWPDGCYHFIGSAAHLVIVQVALWPQKMMGKIEEFPMSELGTNSPAQRPCPAQVCVFGLI